MGLLARNPAPLNRVRTPVHSQRVAGSRSTAPKMVVDELLSNAVSHANAIDALSHSSQHVAFADWIEELTENDWRVQSQKAMIFAFFSHAIACIIWTRNG